MSRLVAWFRPKRHRAYVYRVATSVGTVLTAGGLATQGRVGLALAVIGAVLGLGGSGLATANTSTQADD